MPKRKNKEDKTKDMVVKVKSLITDLIVREWLNTPIKEWKNRTPLQIINSGNGERLIEAIQKADDESKKERENGPIESTVEDCPEEEGTYQCSNFI